jgi:hypothetical protein
MQLSSLFKWGRRERDKGMKGTKDIKEEVNDEDKK